jgi:hypothetical protein
MCKESQENVVKTYHLISQYISKPHSQVSLYVDRLLISDPILDCPTQQWTIQEISFIQNYASRQLSILSK